MIKPTDHIRDWLDNFCEGAVVLEPGEMDSAIVGATSGGEQIVYSYEALVEAFMDQGMDYETAVEFLDYNTIRAIEYMGDRKPIIVYEFPK